MNDIAIPTVTIAEAKSIISAMAHKQSILLLSAPGVGKSDAVRQAAAAAGLECRSLLGTQIAPEDVSGIPRIVGELVPTEEADIEKLAAAKNKTVAEIKAIINSLHGSGGDTPRTKPEARGSGWEDQPHIQGAVAARAQEGLEELSHVEGQEGRR